MGFDELREQVLTLPNEDRATLARDLINSLPDSCRDSEQLQLPQGWLDEINARSDALGRGELEGDDWRTSLERVRSGIATRKNS